jgi:hypothetical protein
LSDTRVSKLAEFTFSALSPCRKPIDLIPDFILVLDIWTANMRCAKFVKCEQSISSLQVKPLS